MDTAAPHRVTLEAPDAPDRGLGRRLRRLREERGLTLKTLARRARVPASTISKIENGQLKPSLVHAINLARALGENLGFLADEYRQPPQPFSVVTRGSRREIAYGDMGLILADLTGSFQPGILEARLGRLQPGATSGAEPMTHAGEELCHVLEGGIRYRIEDAVHDLFPGDSIHFKSDLPHRWESLGRETTQVVWVFSDGLSF